MLRYSEGFVREVNVSSDKTLAVTDQGFVQNVVEDALVITLPAAVPGAEFIVRVGGKAAGGPVGSGSNKSVGVAISPNAADKFVGLGSAGTDDKDLLLAKADSKVGNYVRLVGQTDGWNIVEADGNWTRQP